MHAQSRPWFTSSTGKKGHQEHYWDKYNQKSTTTSTRQGHLLAGIPFIWHQQGSSQQHKNQHPAAKHFRVVQEEITSGSVLLHRATKEKKCGSYCQQDGAANANARHHEASPDAPSKLVRTVWVACALDLPNDSPLACSGGVTSFFSEPSGMQGIIVVAWISCMDQTGVSQSHL